MGAGIMMTASATETMTTGAERGSETGTEGGTEMQGVIGMEATADNHGHCCTNTGSLGLEITG